MADDIEHSPICFKTPEENLLYYSRAGDYKAVLELLNLWVEEKAIDINCKGNLYMSSELKIESYFLMHNYFPK